MPPDSGAVRPPPSSLQSPSRGPVYGTRGVVAAPHPIAGLIGVDVLRKGGNAVDAALAISAALVVVQPAACHLGGDAFTIIRTGERETLALNAGGRAPLAASTDRFASGIPPRGPAAATVPGLVDAWCAIHKRLATRPLSDLLAPAIALAGEGHAISPQLAFTIRGSQDVLASDPGCAEVFLADGPPRSGTVLKQPDLARSLEAIASDGREGFYDGSTGRAIASFMRANHGLITETDLARDQAVWGEPLSTRFHDWTVFEQPLPSQGFATLEALNIIERCGLGSQEMLSTDTVHTAAEAMRLAFADRDAYAGDPDAVEVPVERLLSKEYASELRSRIKERAAREAVAAHGGDTTSFAVADGEGHAVTFIQSIFAVWGAAALVPGTGVLLNNRMTGFSLHPPSPNVLRPGMRTVHTLNTWLMERHDGRVYAGGTPGAHYQVQANLQTIAGIAEWRLDPQGAIDAPKWVWSGDQLMLEGRFPPETIEGLRARGHRVEEAPHWATGLCRMQIVGVDSQDGRLIAASDLRSEGCALGV
jgi:gamma-glutamyltranspeptidase / glutathione hydrolase